VEKPAEAKIDQRREHMPYQDHAPHPDPVREMAGDGLACGRQDECDSNQCQLRFRPGEFLDEIGHENIVRVVVDGVAGGQSYGRGDQDSKITAKLASVSHEAIPGTC
jgi:hypothetical protein